MKNKLFRKKFVKVKPDWFKGCNFKVNVPKNVVIVCDCELCWQYRKKVAKDLASLTDKKE